MWVCMYESLSLLSNCELWSDCVSPCVCVCMCVCAFAALESLIHKAWKESYNVHGHEVQM